MEYGGIIRVPSGVATFRSAVGRQWGLLLELLQVRPDAPRACPPPPSPPGHRSLAHPMHSSPPTDLG